MEKTLFITFCLISSLVFSHTPSTGSKEWIVYSSSVKFKIKNTGFNVDGTLGSLTAKIIFDASKAFGNSIDATIESKSINTGNETRDGHLKKADYFDVAKFPTINMKASVISKEKDGTFKGYFKLTMKGKTKDVFVPFTFKEKDGKAILKGELTINRLDFGVGESSMMLSDSATITIEVNVTQK